MGCLTGEDVSTLHRLRLLQTKCMYWLMPYMEWAAVYLLINTTASAINWVACSVLVAGRGGDDRDKQITVADLLELVGENKLITVTRTTTRKGFPYRLSRRRCLEDPSS